MIVNPNSVPDLQNCNGFRPLNPQPEPLGKNHLMLLFIIKSFLLEFERAHHEFTRHDPA